MGRVTLKMLVQFLRGVKNPTIPEADREAVSAAFREVLLNAMEHGGQFDPSHYVEISFIRASRAIALRVKDPGQGFSLDELRHAAINSPAGIVLNRLRWPIVGVNWHFGASQGVSVHLFVHLSRCPLASTCTG